EKFCNMRCGRSSGTSLLVQQVWHTDLSANRQARCFIAAIDQLEVVEKILRHLGLWNGGPDFAPARAPPDPAGPKMSSPTEDQPPERPLLPLHPAVRRWSASRRCPSASRWLPLLLQREERSGERIPQTKTSRLESLNRSAPVLGHSNARSRE